MITTPNMSLTAWDQATDPYDHNQLATNWAIVDQHDHTTGKGVQIPTAGIQDGAITAAKIAPGAIPAFTIPNGSVTKAMLAPGVLGIDNFSTFPAARIRNTADQTLLADPVTGWATVGFNAVVFDPDNMHPTPSSNELVIQQAGVYIVTATVAISQPDPASWANFPWDSNGVQTRLIQNGGNPIAHDTRLFSHVIPWYKDFSRGVVTTTVTAIYRFAVNDYIQVQSTIMTPTYRFTIPSLAYSPVLSASWIGN